MAHGRGYPRFKEGVNKQATQSGSFEGMILVHLIYKSTNARFLPWEAFNSSISWFRGRGRSRVKRLKTFAFLEKIGSVDYGYGIVFYTSSGILAWSTEAFEGENISTYTYIYIYIKSHIFYREILSLSQNKQTFPEVEESRPRDTLRNRSTQATGATHWWWSGCCLVSCHKNCGLKDACCKL